MANALLDPHDLPNMLLVLDRVVRIDHRKLSMMTWMTTSHLAPDQLSSAHPTVCATRGMKTSEAPMQTHSREAISLDPNPSHSLDEQTISKSRPPNFPAPKSLIA